MEKVIDKAKIHNPELVEKAQKALSNTDIYEYMSLFFKTFGDETRLKIIALLSDTELCVNDIAYVLDMQQSAISHQMRLLKNARLVKQRKDGKMVYYSLDDEHVEQIFEIGMEHVSHKKRLK